MRCKALTITGQPCAEKARLFGYCIRHISYAFKKSKKAFLLSWVGVLAILVFLALTVLFFQKVFR